MTTKNVEQALELARAEARTLAEQLRQARADIHRLVSGEPGMLAAGADSLFVPVHGDAPMRQMSAA